MCYRVALKLHNSHKGKKMCLNGLGEAYYNLGDYEGALHYFNEALKGGSNYWSHYHSFLALYKLQKFPEAKEALDKAYEDGIKERYQLCNDRNKIEKAGRRRKYVEYVKAVKLKFDQEMEENTFTLE